MSWLSLFRSVGAKIVSVPILAFVLGIWIPGVMGYHLLQYGAQQETREKASTALELLSAVPHYTKEESNNASDAKVTQQIMQRYEAEHHQDAFRFRRVALSPTDPKNLASNEEAPLIRGFVDNPKLTRTEGETQIEGKGYHLVAVPITVSQDRCLHCHGSPKGAPAWRLQAFGRTAGFGWKKGQVVGAQIVTMPSDGPRNQAALSFWSVAKCVGLLGAICVLVLFLRAHFLIARPVKKMLATSQAIQQGEWGEWAQPWFPDELATLGTSFHQTTFMLRDRVAREEKLRSLFQQFIPASLAAKALGKDTDEILVGTRHAVTVMIINIRNFKLLMDHLPPAQTVTTLNEYFSEVNKIIVANKGLVSKYMGDSVMALFGMPLGQENHALSAVRAALSIPAALQNLYVRLDEKYGWELGVGIGISTGDLIVGSFGSSVHREYSVLGDVVGEAHQLEAATKAVPEEDSILISEATYRHVMSDVHVLDLGEKQNAQGKSIHAYAVQGFRNEVRSSLAA